MTPDALAPLSVQADLLCEHPNGNLRIESPDASTIHLRFSSSNLFRTFLDDFAKGNTNFKALDQVQSIIDTTQITVQLFIEDKQVIRLAPGEPADMSYTRLIPQWLLSRLGF